MASMVETTPANRWAWIVELTGSLPEIARRSAAIEVEQWTSTCKILCKFSIFRSWR